MHYSLFLFHFPLACPMFDGLRGCFNLLSTCIILCFLFISPLLAQCLMALRLRGCFNLLLTCIILCFFFHFPLASPMFDGPRGALGWPLLEYDALDSLQGVPRRKSPPPIHGNTAPQTWATSSSTLTAV